MLKSVCFALSVLLLNTLVTPAAADGTAEQKEERKTYTIACTVVRELQSEAADGKKGLETIEEPVPDITTLEGTRAGYHSGAKVGSTPYRFRLWVKVKPVSGDKVRMEVRAEDSSPVTGGLNPLIEVMSLRVVRRVALGKAHKLELGKNAKGEGRWIELKVQEFREE